jgi:aminoglycoside phosphotransferase (APT) family kinase protein
MRREAGLSARNADVDLQALADLVGRIFPPPGSCRIERTESGTSTQVYRIRRGGDVFYLRIAENRAASLGPEVRVHEVLRARGVRVPAVVHFESFEERLARSVMVTEEIPGAPLADCSTGEAAAEVLRAAGRDLAVLNGVPVRGFGWIERTAHGGGPLQAGHGTFRSFALEGLDDDLALLGRAVWTPAESAAIRGMINRRDYWLHVDQAWLAHGDFDVSHIYQRDGRYTGIIDFGEIRGAHRLYDLGHLHAHDAAWQDGELVPRTTLPALLEGYAEVVPLPPDHRAQISLVSVLIGIHAMARNVRRHPPNAYQRHLASTIRSNVASLQRF